MGAEEGSRVSISSARFPDLDARRFIDSLLEHVEVSEMADAIARVRGVIEDPSPDTVARTIGNGTEAVEAVPAAFAAFLVRPESFGRANLSHAPSNPNIFLPDFGWNEGFFVVAVWWCRCMEVNPVDEAIKWLEKANADLEPELLSSDAARDNFARYARAEKLVAYGLAALARKIDDAPELARVTGTSVGRAKQTIETGKHLGDSGEVAGAFRGGDISLDQATAIAKAEAARPGTAPELLSVATGKPFHVLKDQARKVVLDAEQTKDLGARQRAARSARSYSDDLGMVNIHLTLEPHVGTPIVNRAEADADRRARKARRDGDREPFARHLADAYAALLAGSGKGRTTRPELVVVVSHGVAKRGWTGVKAGEVCKIPGVGPVPPAVAKEIASDAFLSGVFYDGTDLRHFRRWTRNVPVAVEVALELGPPPDFDGIACVDCGNRFRNERDHVDPHTAGGPASTDNLNPRCWSCHKAKTARDRRAGKLRRKRGPP